MAATLHGNSNLCLFAIADIPVGSMFGNAARPPGMACRRHCDASYWPLATDKAVTAWIPLQVCCSANAHPYLALRDRACPSYMVFFSTPCFLLAPYSWPLLHSFHFAASGVCTACTRITAAVSCNQSDNLLT